MSFAASGVLIVSQISTTSTNAKPGNTLASANGWALQSGSAYIPTTAPLAEFIVIQFETNVAGCGLWVLTDGGANSQVATVGGQNCIYMPPNTTTTTFSAGMQTFENIQANQNWNVQGGAGTYYSLPGFPGTQNVNYPHDQSMSWNRHAQSGMTGVHLWNNAPNYVSFITEVTTTSAQVTITFQ